MVFDLDKYGQRRSKLSDRPMNWQYCFFLPEKDREISGGFPFFFFLMVKYDRIGKRGTHDDDKVHDPLYTVRWSGEKEGEGVSSL